MLATTYVTNTIGTILEGITGAASVAGVGYYLACLRSVQRFLHERAYPGGHSSVPDTDESGFLPPVSILKPLKGEDPEIYESFRSHCRQEYPEYEIIFGVSDPQDPAVRAVERLRQQFPQHAIRLVVCSQTLGTNTKVSNLAQMAREARYEHLIVSDSDIRVAPDYLRKVMPPLADERVGMVTCLYRGIAGQTLGSRLESLGISTDFCAGVLVARWLERGVRFALGSTLAFRRRELAAIGGFESFVDYLADDYELGKRIAALGLEVKLSEVVVETFLPAYSLREFLTHQLRWARGVRDARRGGYLGLLFTFGWVWAALAVATSGGAMWAWSLLGTNAVLRLLVASTMGSCVLGDRQIGGFIGWLPLRDLIALLIWAGSFGSNRVTWRGDRFELKNGKLIRLESLKR
jgi:ceramide glucosyltransferase